MMWCPKRIKELARKRADAAYRFQQYDYELSKWCDAHGIETDSADTHLGVESVVNPYESSKRVLEAIEESKGKGSKNENT